MDTKELPLVTIFAPCYNHEAFCIEGLESIRNQDYPAIQLIITDDGSKDNSVKLIQNWIEKNNVDCTFIANETNIGLTKTLNLALKEARGKFIKLISCDDVLEPNHLSSIVHKFNKLDAKVGLIVSDYATIDELGNTINPSATKKNIIEMYQKSDFLFEELVNNYHIAAPAAMYRREVFDKIGKYDENISFEDVDINLRTSRYFSMEYVDIPTVKYRLHGNNFSATLVDKRLVKGVHQAIMKHVNDFTNTSRRRTKIGLEKFFLRNFANAKKVSLAFWFQLVVDFFKKTKHKKFVMKVILKSLLNKK